MLIVSWNVTTLWKRLAEVPAMIASLGDPDVLCLQEVRVLAADVASLDVVPGYTCHASLPRDRRMYGVVTYVREALRARGEVPDFDDEGRVVFTHLDALTVGNVYMVNGTSDVRHARKRRLQDDVFARAKALHPVVMAGDWNVSRTAQDITPRLRTEELHSLARAQLNAHLETAGLHDVWRERNPDARGYTWFNVHARRLDAARVDYMLVSTDLLPRVEEAEILERRAGSDHAPITLRLR